MGTIKKKGMSEQPSLKASQVRSDVRTLMSNHRNKRQNCNPNLKSDESSLLNAASRY